MLRIAVCDDNSQDIKTISALLHAYFQARPDLLGQVTVFAQGEALLTLPTEELNFDLYLLDVLMPGINGIQLGHRLRERVKGVEIIYLSTSDDYAVDSYEVRAFFYLRKPVEEEKLFEVLDRAVEKLKQRQDSSIIVHTAQGPRRVMLEHIRYVERVGRIMRYHCTDSTVDSQTIRASFKEMAAPLLADHRFCLCGASFVLNFQHVTGVSNHTALLDDGNEVILPRAAAAAFKHAWGKYWLEETATW